jgi:hypothetical protein
MSRSYTTEDLRVFLRFHSQPLGGIEETEHEWWLGSLSLSKHHPTFRSGYSHQLEPNSTFRKRWFDPTEFSPRCWVVIFQAFDPNETNPEPPEYLVGWVPPEREQELDKWLAFLNGEIANRLDAARSIREEPAASTNMLRYVGYFYELGYDDHPNAPRLSEARGKRPAQHKAEVVRYLKSGKTLIYSPGIATDVFDDSATSDTPSIVTDGTYAWRKEIAYYVDRYDIELPSEFEAHMRANDWKVPESIDIRNLKVRSVDPDA